MKAIMVKLVIDTHDTEVFDDFEAARIENEGVTIRTVQGSYAAEVVTVEGG